MAYQTDPRVDAYIDALPAWQPGGHENKTARTIAIRQEESINTRALGVMVAQIIANNRAGGGRRLESRARPGRSLRLEGSIGGSRGHCWAAGSGTCAASGEFSRPRESELVHPEN